MVIARKFKRRAITSRILLERKNRSQREDFTQFNFNSPNE
jgi:hypothetical protein